MVGHLTALTFLLTLGKKSASSEAAMLAAISGFDRNAVSRETAIRSWTLLKPAMDICASYWSSVPTMSSGATERTRPYDRGVSV